MVTVLDVLVRFKYSRVNNIINLFISGMMFALKVQQSVWSFVGGERSNMEIINSVIVWASDLVWTWLVVGLCTVAGLYTTVKLRFVQLRMLPHALALLRGRHAEGQSDSDISTIQALATTLASTTGVGNIAGVAVAISLGGPGAIFWMWMMALLNMSIKFVEAALGSMYRHPEAGKGGAPLVGGPMYYIAEGLGARWKPIAIAFAFLGSISFLGAWNTFQSNQASAIVLDQFGVPTWLTAFVLMVFSAMVLIGGIHRIGQVAEKIVPAMALLYLGGVAIILLTHLGEIPSIFALIIRDAFNFEAGAGGALGMMILIGVKRAVFSNEAGSGSAAIAFAAAHSNHPIRKGVVAGVGPFIDTVIICTATALVILLAGMHGDGRYQPMAEKEVVFASHAEAIARSGWRLNETDQQVVLQTAQASTPLAIPFDPQIQADGYLLTYKGEGLTVSFVSDTGLVAYTQALPVAGSVSDMRIILPEGLSGDTSWFLTLKGVDAHIIRLVPLEALNGIVLSTAAFAEYFGHWSGLFITLAAVLFSYTSIIAGSYYGEVCAQYLSPRFLKPYVWIYVLTIMVGGLFDLGTIINASDLALGLACLPNLIAIILLTPRVAKEQERYRKAMGMSHAPVNDP
jgi:AGCS family alanine or glycine:cation symporter